MKGHEGKSGIDRGRVAEGLRRGAEILDHGSVVDVVEEVIHEPGVRQAVERVVEHVQEGGDHPRSEHSVPTLSATTSMHATGSLKTAATTMPNKKPDSATIERDGYTVPTPWSGELADVVVVCCSSEKYEKQNQEFVEALGFRMPHFIQVPGGPSMLYGLAVVKGFLAKAVGMFVAKAVDLLNVTKVILIAHEECGAYKAGKVALLGELTRRLSSKDTKEVQLEHLRKSARELQAQLGSGVVVQAWYASILHNGHQQIHYEPVLFDSRVRD